MRWILAIITLVVIGGSVPGVGGAQIFPDANGASLAGVEEFDAAVAVLVWLSMDEDEETFRANANASFILALRRDGVRVESSAPNYLLCNIAVAKVLDTTAAYYWSIQYYDYNATGLHTLLWMTGGISTVGLNNFTPESTIEGCANAFASEWLRWNPN